MQLHIVEELLALFSQEEAISSENTELTPEETETVCSLSIHALTGAPLAATGVIQLHAYIADQEVLLLVDSGSSTSFINK